MSDEKVFASVMPKGVEHTQDISGPIGPGCVCFSDAERR